MRFGTAEILRDLDRADGWLLSVGGIAQSYVDLADPAHLEFDYMRRIADVLDCLPGGPLDVLHVGGGAGTLARYLAATRPGSAQGLVDADAELVALAVEQFGLDRVPGLEVVVGEGRPALAAAGSGSRDVVILDAFVRAVVPEGMVTVESVSEVARVLRADGVCLVNVTDGPGLPYARRVLATLGAVFAEVMLVGEPAVLRGRRFSNLVVAASAAPLPVAEVAGRAAAAPFPARCVTDRDLRELSGSARPMVDGEPVTAPVPPPDLFT
ncbi:spermidine synthase [Actinokineospora spheciospongiae]|uniref:spermidine synthase n=1 Tax=Actinokineospora spheciospongiae TaxID=909613 RepID=UPI0004AF6A6D|nr:fused MFS/spermidine synthase [Actinokineospora spheciospongiae]